jgi:hypothetical protein
MPCEVISVRVSASAGEARQGWSGQSGQSRRSQGWGDAGNHQFAHGNLLAPRVIAAFSL